MGAARGYAALLIPDGGRRSVTVARPRISAPRCSTSILNAFSRSASMKAVLPRSAVLSAATTASVDALNQRSASTLPRSYSSLSPPRRRLSESAGVAPICRELLSDCASAEVAAGPRSREGLGLLIRLSVVWPRHGDAKSPAAVPVEPLADFGILMPAPLRLASTLHAGHLGHAD